MGASLFPPIIYFPEDQWNSVIFNKAYAALLMYPVDQTTLWHPTGLTHENVKKWNGRLWDRTCRMRKARVRKLGGKKLSTEIFTIRNKLLFVLDAHHQSRTNYIRLKEKHFVFFHKNNVRIYWVTLQITHPFWAKKMSKLNFLLAKSRPTQAHEPWGGGEGGKGYGSPPPPPSWNF